ncbi:MAG: choice-of-anchor D domain-containing protein [Acidobacteria bacterium]|nr:choice-of-anchor D domain-containing protein [Acidobacteriota bacterium]
MSMFRGIGFLLVVTASASAQLPIPLTPAAPRVVNVNDLSPGDGATLTSTPNADGSLAVTLSRPGQTGSGSFKIAPPASATGIDGSTVVSFSPAAEFNISGTWSGQSTSAAMDVYAGGTQLTACRTTFAATLRTNICRLSSVPTETVNGTRFAYIETVITVVFGIGAVEKALLVRFYFTLASDGCPAANADSAANSKPGPRATTTPSCTPQDLAVDNIVVVQSVQRFDLGNPLPLVPGKATLVRVFLKSLGENAKNIGLVTGTLSAAGFNSPVSALNDGVAVAPPRPSPDEQYHSLNFLLPEEWTKVRSLDLSATVKFDGPAEIHTDNNTKRFSISFDPSLDEYLIVDVFDICFQGKDGQECPEAAYAADAITRSAFPIAEDKLEFIAWGFLGGRIEWPGPIPKDESYEDQKLWNLADVYRTILKKARKNSRNHHVFFALPGRLQTLDAGTISSIFFDDDCPSVTGNCLERTQRYLAQSLGETLVSDYFSILRGSIDAYGWDSGNPNSIVRSTSPLRIDSDRGWFSPEFYERFAKAIRPSPVQPARLREATDSPDTLVVSGRLADFGNQGQLDPALRIPGAGAEMGTSGTFCVRLQRATGEDVDSCFDMRDPAKSSSPFTVELPYYADATRLSLIRRDSPSNELAFYTGGEAPVVSFAAPRKGDVWQGKQTLVWSGSDPSGKEITYTLLYSSDGGVNWLPLGIPTTQGSYLLDTTRIKGGTDVYFRVAASSGLATSITDVGPVEIRQNPRLEVDTPTVDFSNQTIGGIGVTGIRLRNTGTGPLTVTPTLPPDSPFSIFGSPRQITIGSGGSAEIAVRFRPGTAGQHEVPLTLTAPDSTTTGISLRGSAFSSPVPAIVTPASFDFGRVPMNTSRDVPITVRNDGRAQLRIQSVTSSSTAFQADPLNVDPENQAQLLVRVRPASAGVIAGRLTLRTNDPTRGTVTIDVTVTGDAPAGPAIALNPAPPYNFGNVTVGATGSINVTLTNSGTSALTINSLTKSNTAFTLADGLPLTINPGQPRTITLRFSPTAASTITDNWTFVTNPANGLPSFTVSGTGVAGGSSTVLEVRAGNPLAPITSWDFGSVAANSQGSVTFQVNNRGTSSVIVSTSFSNSRFSLGAPITSSFAIGAGSFENAQILFKPVDASAQTGTVTFTAGSQIVRIELRGNSAGGTGGGTTSATLSVDKGDFEITAGFPAGGVTGSFVNRLTPPSYPATLRSVLVFFPAGELPLNTPVTILSAANLSGAGGPQLTGMSFTRTNSTITAQESYVEIPVTPVTISSGDFVVGFSAVNPPNVFPVVVDTVASKQRSYISQDGALFRLVDSTNIGAGNFGIRARVDLGSGTAPTTSITASPSSVDFGPVAQGTTSQPSQILITNTGATTVNLTLSTAPPYAASPASVSSLAAGGTSTVFVTFSPFSATPSTQPGTLTIASAGTALATVSLSGSVTTSGGGGTPGAGCVPAPANQVSWFSGDGSASDLGGGNNATLVGGATFAPGRVGQAFQFDGTTGYARIGNPANLRFTNAVSIEAWINPRATRTGVLSAITTKWAQIFADTPDSDSYGLWLNTTSAGVRLFSALHLTGAREPNVEGGTIPLNTWSHVAMTYDGASGRYTLYVNGQQVAAQTVPGQIFASNRNVLIGREDSFLTRNFDGLIDEVGLYGRELSAAEIQSVFNAGTSGKCKTGSGGGGSGGGTPGAGCPNGIGTSAIPGLPARPTCAAFDTTSPLAASLAGLFLMNEGSGAVTSNLVNGNTAFFSGSAIPAWNPADPSITFRGGASGNSFLNAGTDAVFDRMPVNRFTIVAKINVATPGAYGIAEKNDGNSADGFLFGMEASGDLKLTVEKSSNIRVLATGGAIRTGQWMQVAVTWDGNVGTAAAGRLYVNGVEQSKVVNNNGSGTLGFAAATNQPFRIGSGSFDSLGSMNGKMAYLAVYNGRILSSAEMTQLDARLPIR